MPLSAEYVGRVYPPTDPYDVSRAKIREFARAIKAGNPLHHDVAAARRLGFADLVAPPTFPALITIEAGHQALFDPGLGLDYGRSFHGSQRFDYRRPIVAGDVIQVVISVADVSRRERNESVTLRGDVLTPEGELIVVSTSIIVTPHRTRT
jgi:acyl dehydratase